jgi:divalent metal cation (Fe/Co/Zn/Cd) transporter
MWLALPLAFFSPSVRFLGVALFFLAGLWLFAVAAGRLLGRTEMTPALWFLVIMLTVMLVTFALAAVWFAGFYH